MRRLLKPLWIFLALLFIAEEWLWSHLEPVVARLVALIPLHALKLRVAAFVERLPPYMTLVVFVVPHAVTFLTETTLIWLFRDTWWVVATVLVMAKFIGVALAAFLFQATREKLMQMAWFARGYDIVMRGLAWAHDLADPYIAPVREWIATLRRDGEIWRMVRAIRERVRKARSV